MNRKPHVTCFSFGAECLNFCGVSRKIPQLVYNIEFMIRKCFTSKASRDTIFFIGNEIT